MKSIYYVFAALALTCSCTTGQYEPDDPIDPVKPDTVNPAKPDTIVPVKEPSAAISWIDDDFNVYDWTKHGEFRPAYTLLHDFCLKHKIFMDFARGPLSVPYDAPAPQRLVDLCLLWQGEGFAFLHHPGHSQGWYDYDAEHKHDASLIEASAMECFVSLEHYGINAPKILVWPGNSAEYPDNYPVVERLYDCGVMASYKGTNHRAENNRYSLRRLSLECLSKGYFNKTEFKQYIKNAVDNGDWIILGSHMASVEVSDVPDETSYNTANVFEIIQYADSLCHIRHTADVWNERKHLWE